MARKHEVESITSAPTSLAEDQSKRVHRYLIQMSIRTACLIAAFYAQGWLRLLFVIGAVFLPYFAVIEANNTRVTRRQNTHPVEFLQLQAEREATSRNDSSPDSPTSEGSQ